MEKNHTDFQVHAIDNSTVTGAHILTMAEVAAILGVSMPTVYKLAKMHDFPCFRVGRGLRVREDHLTEWISKQMIENNPRQ